jgi:maleate isomerase
MGIWKPDGSGSRARIGVLQHHDQTITESEFWTMAPEGVSVHTARVPFHDYRTYANPPGPDDATEVLAALQLQCIVYGFTAGSYLLGTTGERALVARLEQRSRGVPVLMPGPAAAAAFRALSVKRIAMFNPPWYIGDMDQNGIAYFREQGFEVVRACHLTPEIAVPHPDYGPVHPAELYDFVHKNAPPDVDGVFVSGNGWRTIGVIAALEEDLGRPVLTATQASFWYALRRAGVGARLDHYGQLFTKNVSSEFAGLTVGSTA